MTVIAPNKRMQAPRLRRWRLPAMLRVVGGVPDRGAASRGWCR